MFLKEIKLKNFRGFTESELSFRLAPDKKARANNRKISLLIGQNGTGKTNLLKAIALVTVGRDALPELLGDPKSWVQNGKKECRITATVETADRAERNLHLVIKRTDTVSKVLARAKESLEELDTALDYTNRSYFILAYGASRRLNLRSRSRRKSSFDYRHSRARGVATLFDPDASLIPIEDWAMDIDYLNKPGAMNIVKNVLSEFLGEVDFARIDKRQGQLLFKTPQGVVPMNQLSDGYQNVAAWIGDLLYQVTETFGDYKEPLKTRGLLLIDEIDLHLHPKWQRSLLKFLRTKLPNFQIIATTHSPFMAQQAEVNELFYIERPRSKVTIHAFEGKPKMLLLNQIVSSEIFGVTSDESLEMERQKKRFEKLSEKKTLSATQQKEYERLQDALSNEHQNMRSNVMMTKSQLALLKKIDRELSG